VITVVADVGQLASEIASATERAETLTDVHCTLDLKNEFVDDLIVPSIKANGCYEGYVLGTALARPLIAKKIVEIAESENAVVMWLGGSVRQYSLKAKWIGKCFNKCFN